MMNRDDKQKRVTATDRKVRCRPSREKTEQPRKLRVEALESRVAPNAIWGD